MEILKSIIDNKRKEIELKKQRISIKMLEKSEFFGVKMPSFYDALNQPSPSIIAEYKRKSPSKGIINLNSDVKDVAIGYEEAGVAAISILTDFIFFGGESDDLKKVAAFINIPILRKDFIVDEYQVIESKAIGACAILLIASVLNKNEIKNLSNLASNLGLEVLFEIHTEKDIEKLSPSIRIIGVNNRNLLTFETDIEHSASLFSALPDNCLKVAESGIRTHTDVLKLFNSGYDAFLIGEHFMRTEDPGKAAARFIKKLESI